MMYRSIKERENAKHKEEKGGRWFSRSLILHYLEDIKTQHLFIHYLADVKEESYKIPSTPQILQCYSFKLLSIIR